MTFALSGFDLDAFVAATLAEDLGSPPRDVTSESVIPADARFDGVMDSRDAIVVAGLPIAAAFFRALDPAVEIELLVGEGDIAAPGTDLMRLSGSARALLTAERSALNTVQHLSGIATLTRSYVDAIAGTGCTLLDTRKTIPGLRVLEKYATRMGGATNHRMGLWDAAMIKDNHVAVAGSVGEATRRARDAGVMRIIVEVDRIDQIDPALAAGATHLLLDNMDAAMLRVAVGLVAGRVPTEASGGVTLETIRAKAETGVTYISVGRLTQSAPAADIGLDFSAARLVSPATIRGSDIMDRPQSILWFERCYLGAVGLGLVNTALSWSKVQEQIAATPNSAMLPDWFVPLTIALGIGINMLLWYFVARRGSVVAKWIVTVFFAIGLLSVVRMAIGGAAPPAFNAIGIVVLVLQAIAVVMLFRPDTRAWFGSGGA